MKWLFGRGAGWWGERKAERYLLRKGYKILGRRVHVGVRDEIDLIARDGKILVFVEVKTRGSEDYGRPADAVDRRKRRALTRAAMRYMGALKSRPDFFRFDVVEVIGREEEGEPEVRHVENAFALGGRWFYA